MQGSTRIDELRQKFHENPRRYFAPLANEYRKAGDPEQAIAICRAHLAQQPGHMSGHVVYGQALYDAKRIEEARVVFEKALSLDPDNAIVLRQLGDIARQKGETTEAKHWYSRALDADPQDTEVAAYIAELTEPLTEIGAESQMAAHAEETVAPAEAAAPVEPIAEAEEAAPIEEPAPVEVAQPIEESFAAPVDVVEPEAQPAESLEEASDIEVELPEPAREPEIIPTALDDHELPPLDAEEPAWRKTPHHEESPFVTRTMAELYESQGYHEAALDVYRQLALHHPENREILDRIEALEKPDIQPEPEAPQLIDIPSPVSELHAEAPAEPEPAAMETPGDEDYHALIEPDSFEGLTPSNIPYVQPASGVLTGFDAPLISDVPSEAESTEPAEPQARTDGFFSTQEDEMPGDEPDSSGTRGRHFTEMELDGDTWDTDSWGAGFSVGDDSVSLDFEATDTPQAEPVAASASVSEPEPVASSQPEAVQESTPEPESEIVAEPGTFEPFVTQSAAAEPVAKEPAAVEPIVDEAASEPVHVPEPEPEPEYEKEPEPEPVAAEVIAEAPPEPVAESPYEPEPETELVAYSPQLPEPEDLPHFAPKQPTIREFFATLATRTPPSSEPERSFTARAAVPEIPDVEEYPLAGDAFANMFADSPVSEEDSRAAFALSGALGAPVTPPPVVAPTSAPAAAAAPSTPETTQESEEDIRRFREWLDGLAES
jgi:tetratricopeptide (TPR) repeat protein